MLGVRHNFPIQSAIAVRSAEERALITADVSIPLEINRETDLNSRTSDDVFRHTGIEIRQSDHLRVIDRQIINVVRLQAFVFKAVIAPRLILI